MRSILKNKKGDSSSIIIGLCVIVFAIAIIVLMFSKFFGEMITILKADPTFSANNNTMEVFKMLETNTNPWLDYFFLFSFVATIIGLIISSIYIDVHPAFMIIFLVILVVTIIFGGLFSNVFTMIGETDALASTYVNFPSTKFIMNNLPLIIFIVGILVSFILYGKGKNVGGVQI